MPVKMGSKGGGASSHEGRVNPVVPTPRGQAGMGSSGGGRNNVDAKLHGDKLNSNHPRELRSEIDDSGTAEISPSRPSTIENGKHNTREQQG